MTTAPAPDFDAAREGSVSERAMEDIEALLDGYVKQWRPELSVLMELHQIVGRWDMERIRERKP